LPIAIVPHPFGTLGRDETRRVAVQCACDIARLACTSVSPLSGTPDRVASESGPRLVEVPEDIALFNRFCLEQRWGDGLPLVPPTAERVCEMLKHTRRAPHEVVATIAPALGLATVEAIAINTVLAGCYPEYLPVLIAAAEAVAVPDYNLPSNQTTTNPAAVWLIVNGPIARRLGVNGGNNCLGQGTWANATLGRALRLILQNIGGAFPGDMDRATQGQPGKYTLCCAENEEANPWEPLHVERGFARDASTVTVVGPLGTWSINTHTRTADDLLRVIGDTMAFPASSDYAYGGAPWLIFAPEHAQILKRAGLSKTQVKQGLWERSKLAVSRLAVEDIGHMKNARAGELGEIGPQTLLPVSVRPEDINFIVAGGAGTHSVYLPNTGHGRSVTCEIKP